MPILGGDERQLYHAPRKHSGAMIHTGLVGHLLKGSRGPVLDGLEARRIVVR